MHFGYNNPKIEYNMKGEQLLVPETEKDIGVAIQETLKPVIHIANSLKKANLMLGMIHQPFIHIFYVGTEIIHPSKSIKILGVTLDSNMNNEHATRRGKYMSIFIHAYFKDI